MRHLSHKIELLCRQPALNRNFYGSSTFPDPEFFFEQAEALSSLVHFQIVKQVQV